MDNINESDRARLAKVLEMRAEIADNVEDIFELSTAELYSWQRSSLQESVHYALNQSPFYRKHIGSAADTFCVTGLPEDFQQLPFTTRQNIMDAYPFGLLSTGQENVVRFGQSSGTTGQSIAAYFTAKDWVTNNCSVALFLRQVLTPDDFVAVAVPYELAGVGQDLDRSLELINCTVVALGALAPFCPPERMVKILNETGVTTLICSGTRALFLAEVAEDMGLNPKSDFKINKLLCAGEGISAAKRRALSQVWGANVYSMYGMTETNTLGMFCREQHLHLVENRSYFELVDPETLQPVPSGSAGELVVSSLHTEAMPIIRYRTGDLCKISGDQCPCGSSFRTLQHLGRLSDHIVVQGKQISMLQLEDLILGRMTEAPYYYGIKVKDDVLQVGLTLKDSTEKTKESIREDFNNQYHVPVEFLSITKEMISNAVRNAVKPTMKTISLD